MMKNLGTGMFVFPHQVVPGSNGNVWVVDGRAADGKGMQVMKVSPYGKGLMAVGQGRPRRQGFDLFDQPTSVAIACDGDAFVAEGHAPTLAIQRIRKFDKNGRFTMTFGRVGSADGELKSPHVIVFDSHGRLFVADCGNSRVNIFDQAGKCLPGWK